LFSVLSQSQPEQEAKEVNNGADKFVAKDNARPGGGHVVCCHVHLLEPEHDETIKSSIIGPGAD
jgi:hypothetical protein